MDTGAKSFRTGQTAEVPLYYNISTAELAATGPTVAKIQQAFGYLQRVRDNCVDPETSVQFRPEEKSGKFNHTITAIWEKEEKAVVLVYWKIDDKDDWKSFSSGQETDVPPWVKNIAPEARVYKLFLDEVLALPEKDVIQSRIKQLSGGQQPRRILLVGHSIGGALATVFAPRAALQFPSTDIRLITFGSPCVGNAAFASVVRWLTTLSYRVILRNDIVPEKYPSAGILSTLKHVDNVVILGKKDFAKETFKSKKLNTRRVWQSVVEPRSGNWMNHEFDSYAAAIALAEFTPKEIPSSRLLKFVQDLGSGSTLSSSLSQSSRLPQSISPKKKSFSCINCLGDMPSENAEIQELAEKSFLGYKKDVDVATGREMSMAPMTSPQMKWDLAMLATAQSVFTIPTRVLGHTVSTASSIASSAVSGIRTASKSITSAVLKPISISGDNTTAVDVLPPLKEYQTEEMKEGEKEMTPNGAASKDPYSVEGSLDSLDDLGGVDMDGETDGETTTVLSDAEFQAEASDLAVEDGDPVCMDCFSMDHAGKMIFRGKIRQALYAAKASYYQADYKFQRVTGTRASTIVKDKAYDTNLHVAWHDGSLILAARGTVSVTATIQDIKFFSWQVDFMEHFAKSRAHIGFLNQVLSVTKGDHSALEAGIQKVMPLGQNPSRVVVTGHSLGAGVATLFAAWAAYRFPLADIRCITFGSPRVGNIFFKEAFGLLVGNSMRVVHARDPLINLPPSVTENTFAHLDTYVFFMKGRVLLGGRPKKLEFTPNNFDHYLYSYLRGAKKIVPFPRGLQDWDEECPDLSQQELAQWNQQEKERLQLEKQQHKKK